MSFLKISAVAALFAIPAFAAETPAPAPTAVSVPPIVVTAEPDWKSEKLICKRQEVIGSLIQRKRVCATARNWQRQEQNAKDNLRVLTEPGAFSPNGG